MLLVGFFNGLLLVNPSTFSAIFLGLFREKKLVNSIWLGACCPIKVSILELEFVFVVPFLRILFLHHFH